MHTYIIFAAILFLVTPNQGGIHIEFIKLYSKKKEIQSIFIYLIILIDKSNIKKFFRVAKSEQVTCTSDLECMSGFFCKNNDCIAKKPEGSLCLSGRNEECECGKCVLDEIQWIKMCQNAEFCSNYGNYLLYKNEGFIFSSKFIY
jgi:hypothetical protein